jgi:hypothetical protein
MMNPGVARSLAAQRQTELRSIATDCHRTPAARFIPRWHLSLARIRLAHSGSSLVIIISAYRVAWPDRNRTTPQLAAGPGRASSPRARIVG